MCDQCENCDYAEVVREGLKSLLDLGEVPATAPEEWQPLPGFPDIEILRTGTRMVKVRHITSGQTANSQPSWDKTYTWAGNMAAAVESVRNMAIKQARETAEADAQFAAIANGTAPELVALLAEEEAEDHE